MRATTVTIRFELGLLLAIAWTVTCSLGADTDPESIPVSFNNDIRPILSNRCFACHGPDEETIEAGLRLDSQEAATRTLDSGLPAIVIGDPDKSEMLARITSEDLDIRMPPPHFAKGLTHEEVSKLRRWIKQGANYEKHWSFDPPVLPSVPAIDESAFKINSPIDSFVIAKASEYAKKIGWKGKDSVRFQSPPASREVLLRRVSLALIGLPPTVQEQDDFLNDNSPDAYEKLVDRFLASPAFGEHWARLWLDMARYADSNGYADDGPRTIWAYRDWVIRAINSNMPFDQFTREQLAGDLLPNPTDDQLIATAFHRNTLTNNEGGTNDEEFRNVAVVDRVNTTIAVWMGLTMACAQCHTHKYDPITQKEYFEVFALFNQSEDADRRDDSPRLALYSPEQKERRADLSKQQEELTKQLEPTENTESQLSTGLADWEAIQTHQPAKKTIYPKSIVAASGDTLEITESGDIVVQAGRDSDTYTIEWQLPEDVSIEQITRLRIDTQPWPKSSEGTSKSAAEPAVSPKSFFLSEFSVSVEGVSADKPTSKPWKIVKATADFESDNRTAAHAIDGKPKTGWGVSPKLDTPHWIEFQLQARKQSDAPENGSPTRLKIEIAQSPTYLGHVLGNFKLSYSTEPINKKNESQIAPIPIRAIASIPEASRTPKQKRELLQHYVRWFAPEFAEVRSRLNKIEKELAAIKPETDLPIMRELDAKKQRDTHVQIRGNYKVKGEQVHPALPSAFHQLSDSTQPLNRLQLANWLMQENNPLTPRVIANRYWETLFGLGLVRTSEDFGSQGDPPTHRELLDWLAIELMQSKWDTKAFLRKLVLSATYQQSSATNADSSAFDMENVYLTRGPRVRLSAEQVRDATLASAGLLSRKQFGPPVRPTQPSSGLSAAFGSKTDWEVSTGDDKHRRAIYTLWRRSNPYPSMATFDAPNRENCILRRDRTNTPLQALVTMNDPTYIEAAQALARKLIALNEPNAETIQMAYRLVLSRKATAEETTLVGEFYEQTRKAFLNDSDAAQKMATDPIGPMPSELTSTDAIASAGAWTVVANVLLNLDETLMPQ